LQGKTFTEELHASKEKGSEEEKETLTVGETIPRIDYGSAASRELDSLGAFSSLSSA
jgi:hypothetical protein